MLVSYNITISINMIKKFLRFAVKEISKEMAMMKSHIQIMCSTN